MKEETEEIQVPPWTERRLIANLVSKCSKAGAECEDMEKDMEEYEEKIEKLKQEMEAKNNIISRHRSSQIQWMQSVEERDEELRVMSKKEKESERTIEKQRKEILDLKDTVKSERINNEAYVHQLEEEQDEYKAKVAELSSRLRQSREGEAIVQKENDNLTETISALKEELRQLSESSDRGKSEYIKQKQHTEEDSCNDSGGGNFGHNNSLTTNFRGDQGGDGRHQTCWKQGKAC